MIQTTNITKLPYQIYKYTIQVNAHTNGGEDQRKVVCNMRSNE